MSGDDAYMTITASMAATDMTMATATMAVTMVTMVTTNNKYDNNGSVGFRGGGGGGSNGGGGVPPY